MSNVLVISTSLRGNSNSDLLTQRVIDGAREAGHQVESISLKGKEIKFCIGCLACQHTLQCVQRDDAVWIAEKVKEADTLVFFPPDLLFRNERSDENSAGSAESALRGGLPFPQGIHAVRCGG